MASAADIGAPSIGGAVGFLTNLDDGRIGRVVGTLLEVSGTDYTVAVPRDSVGIPGLEVVRLADSKGRSFECHVIRLEAGSVETSSDHPAWTEAVTSLSLLVVREAPPPVEDLVLHLSGRRIKADRIDSDPMLSAQFRSSR